MHKIYFTDFFNIEPDLLEEYGAFNISLINDLPLFTDPFLLFNSENDEYQTLHNKIIKYLKFLCGVSKKNDIPDGLLKAWYCFPEVKQNWLGYSKTGNSGSGLGIVFAKNLHANLNNVFHDFGSETITRSSHIEKLCLVKIGIGRDNISDFVTNLIKGYLLSYTQEFSKKYIDGRFLDKHMVSHVEFNYETETWISKEFLLPTFRGDFVLLTPKDILTKDETWINQNDMIGKFNKIAESIPNNQLRAQLNNYLTKHLPIDASNKQYKEAVLETILKHPEYIDYYLKNKEDSGEEAIVSSNSKVKNIEQLFYTNVRSLINLLSNTPFYNTSQNSFDEAYQKVMHFKHVIENNDGYRVFYKDGEVLIRESDVHTFYRFTFCNTEYDLNAEVNNGRGPVDFTLSKGGADKTLIEFKLGSNSKLKQNLKNQVTIYENANNTKRSIKVIIYFSDAQLTRILGILKELNLPQDKSLVLVDARSNKISASKVKN